MNHRPYRRRILIVNYGVQLRVITYGAASAILAVVFSNFARTILFQNLTPEGGVSPIHFGALALVGVILFTLMTLLGLYLTNTIAGPVYRLHQELKSIARGEPARKIVLRRGDAYQDLIDDFNRTVLNSRGPGADDQR